MICCNQVTEIHSSRYGFAIASSAWGPCNFGPLTDLAILVFREMCKRRGIVQCDEGPVDGVAQVVCHGVIVVVGHQEEGQEEKGEKQGEVEGKVEKLRDNRTSWMVWRWCDKRVNGLELEPSGV